MAKRLLKFKEHSTYEEYKERPGGTGARIFREIADGYIMEQSIRNEIPGTVKEIVSDKVLSEIILETRIGEMAAVITTRSVQDMGLKVGDRVVALVKATNVSVRRQRF
jgi:molybdopterin-binding protein